MCGREGGRSYQTEKGGVACGDWKWMQKAGKWGEGRGAFSEALSALGSASEGKRREVRIAGR